MNIYYNIYNIQFKKYTKMDKFFQDNYKVNMGNKKDLTKDQILE